MDGEKTNTRRCGQLGEGDNDEMSMVDVLNEQARLKADADAVLGASDSKNCTYPDGYLKRQALYSCATCSTDGLAGVCLACSYACHEGHDLYELYTKRDFRCDCGNEKFGSVVCKLYANKTESNSRNRYSQNFIGNYCSCSRPYPDPDDSVEDEMIQCIICEDWHHGRHLNVPVPEEEFSEMICPQCMNKNSFLWHYQVKCQENVKLSHTEENSRYLDIEKIDTEPSSSETSSNEETKHLPGASIKSEANCKQTAGCKRNGDELEEGGSAKKIKIEGECLLKTLNCHSVEDPEKASFWPAEWRKKLCRCTECLEMYKDKDVEFLLDENDTVQAYEDQGKDDKSEEETEASALAGMDRVQQIEVVRGFVDMKTQLNEFLQDFAREGKVVTESDIRGFFQAMEEKRRRSRFGVPQPFCR